MSAVPERSRRPRLSRSIIGLGAVGAVVIVVAGVLATGTRPGPSGSPGGTGIASQPSAEPTSLPSAEPTALAWTPLELADVPAVADITPSAADAGGVATDARFTLTSRDGTAAVDLAKRLTVDPGIRLEVTPGASSTVATLVPTAPLAPSTRYRFHLAAADGSPVGSWAFRTTGPLHIIGMLPANHTTGVPLDTGIEVTFDRIGVAGLDAHFRIEPTVAGRFESHGATWSFVPTELLKSSTTYRVTISAGVALSGSDATLETAVSWAFETVPVGSAPAVHAAFGRALLEVRPGSRPALGLYVYAEEMQPPASLPVQAYRLPTAAAAIGAVRTLEATDWTDVSDFGLVDVAGLTRVADLTAKLANVEDGSGVLELPVVLEPGWYLIDVPSDARDAQTVIQVTSLATYAVTSTTRMVVWVNDVVTNGPVTNAIVSTVDGSRLGLTTATGILDVATPAALRTEPVTSWEEMQAVSPHFLTVRASSDRTAIVDLGASSGPRYPQEVRYAGPTDDWWHMLQVDRSTYRTTDTIHTWGVIRARSDRQVPASVELSLVPAQSDNAAAILKRTVKPSSTGTFVADLPITGLDDGDYEVYARVGGDIVASTWLQVGDIRKPGYQLILTPSRLAFIAGQPIQFTAQAKFFDGSRVPGLAVTAAPLDEQGEIATSRQRQLTTDEAGTARSKLTAFTWNRGGALQLDLVLDPKNPEEGLVRGEAAVVVFPSSDWLTGTATVSDGRLAIGGHLAALDLAKAEKALAAGLWPDNPAGRSLPGRTVRVGVVHLVPVRVQTGTTYDYVEKRSIPIYSYDVKRVQLGSRSVTTSTGGTFALSMAVPAPNDAYEVTLGVTDAAGRRFEVEAYAENVGTFQPYENALWLDGTTEARTGQPFDVTIHRGAATVGDGRYLFLTAQQGIRSATVQAGSTFRGLFHTADLPNLAVSAVSFTPNGYETTGMHMIGVAAASKTLGVTLTSDRRRYAPGDTVHIAIATTRYGRPVVADVVVRATDQKLYAMSEAYDSDSVAALMSWVDGGLLQSYSARFVPGRPDLGGGMGDGGGNQRGDFRDTAAFQLVRTDSSGKATVTFQVPDDLTSWHVAASAVSAGLDAGDASILVPVGLPFFVELTLAPEYLVGERPVLQVRAYGDSLPTGASVRFSVSAPSLGITDKAVSGTAFQTVRVPLPALTAGLHTITVSGQRVGAVGSDSLTRTIRVNASRVSVLEARFGPLDATFAPAGGAGLSTYVITDAGRGALLPILRSLVGADSPRLERAAAAAIAARILSSEFEVDAGQLPQTDFDAARYQRGDGVAILPYASPSWDTAVRAAVLAGELFDRSQLREEFQAIRDIDPNSPESVIGSDADLVEILAGQAAVGEDVLLDLGALRNAPLGGTLDRIWLGIGFLESGDEATARQIEREVLRAHGESFGPLVRVNDAASTNATTALMLVLASGLGDPLAASMSRYLTENETRDQTFALEQAAYARSMLERLPRVSGRFAWIVAGERHEVTLDPGRSFSIALTEAQRASFRLEAIEGSMTVATMWRAPLTAGTFAPGAPVRLQRSVTPPNDAPRDRLVTVQLTVHFDIGVPNGCYQVTDTAPSGLVPLAAGASWPADSEVPDAAMRPYEVVGQRVSWCVDLQTRMPLVYAARVVSPGTFTWEPAVIQLDSAPTIGALTESLTYTIR